jgi:hypothetical protein
MPTAEGDAALSVPLRPGPAPRAAGRLLATLLPATLLVAAAPYVGTDTGQAVSRSIAMRNQHVLDLIIATATPTP